MCHPYLPPNPSFSLTSGSILVLQPKKIQGKKRVFHLCSFFFGAGAHRTKLDETRVREAWARYNENR